MHIEEGAEESHIVFYFFSALISAHITPISTPRHAIAIASTYREKEIKEKRKLRFREMVPGIRSEPSTNDRTAQDASAFGRLRYACVPFRS